MHVRWIQAHFPAKTYAKTVGCGNKLSTLYPKKYGKLWMSMDGIHARQSEGVGGGKKNIGPMICQPL